MSNFTNPSVILSQLVASVSATPPSPPVAPSPPVGQASILTLNGLPDEGSQFELTADWTARLLPDRLNKQFGSQHGWVLLKDYPRQQFYQTPYPNPSTTPVTANIITGTTNIITGTGIVTTGVNTFTTGLTVSNGGFINDDGMDVPWVNPIWSGPNGVLTIEAGVMVPVGSMLTLTSIKFCNQKLRIPPRITPTYGHSGHSGITYNKRGKVELSYRDQDGRKFRIIVPISNFNEMSAIHYSADMIPVP